MAMFSHKRKALVIFCSPQMQGHTRKLLDGFLKPIKESGGWTVEVADAFAIAAQPCTGCKACAVKEACVLHDLDKLDRSLRESDLLVVASPVYNYSFPAPFKAIMDRWQRYFEARFSLNKRPPIKKSRDAVLLLTMGSRDDFAVEVCAHQLRKAFSVMNTNLRAGTVWSGTDSGEEGRAAAVKQAEKIALEILADM